MAATPNLLIWQEIIRYNFQYALLDSIVEAQDILSDKQSTDSEAGIIANNLLTAQYDASTEVLNQDTENAQAVSDDSDKFNAENQIYQNDSATAQTGQNNASTATQNLQTQVSQDGTNLSNLVSLASSLITIGGYVSNLIGHAYS